jgi:5-methylthioribose kinase
VEELLTKTEIRVPLECSAALSQPDLDIENIDTLLPYLRSHRLIQDDAVDARVLKGGVSNRTVLVVDRNRPFVVKQALSKLRTAADWFSDPRRIHTEALGLRWLQKLAPEGAITPLLFEDREQHVIAMAAVPEPHDNWKTLLLGGHLQSSHVQQFAQLLAAIHRNSSQDPKLADVFADRSFFDTLRLEPYYRYSAEQVPAAGPFLHALIEDTWNTRVALVHGDYSPKNILVREGRLVLLDHEVVHFGDPTFDVGFALTHLLSKAHHLEHIRMEFAQAAQNFSAQYLEGIRQTGWSSSAEPRAVRHTLGCLLARVAGRSPLEYLAENKRRKQSAIAVELMAQPPQHLPELVSAFIERLNCQ